MATPVKSYINRYYTIFRMIWSSFRPEPPEIAGFALFFDTHASLSDRFRSTPVISAILVPGARLELARS